MSYDAIVVNLMIASPGDISTERQIVRDVIHEWNAIHAHRQRIVLMPVGWDTHSAPLMGARAQAVINEQVGDPSDVLVGVFWTRLGSPTGEAASGTVEEIDRHRAAGKPVMLYFSNEPVRPDSVDEEQYRALRQFKEQCKAQGLIETYDSIAEFRDKLMRQITQTVLDRYRHTNDSDNLPRNSVELGVRAPRARPPRMFELSQEAESLLLEAAQDPNGTVLCVQTLGGLIVQTNGKALSDEGGDPRNEAKWEGAIHDLVTLGFLTDRGHKGEVFRVTREGYAVADSIRRD